MTTTLDQHIETTPGVCGGQPRLAGTRIRVADVAVLHLRLGRSLWEIAERYDLDIGALHAAIAYYFDHRDELDRRIAEDDDYAAAFERREPSLLKRKLETLGVA